MGLMSRLELPLGDTVVDVKVLMYMAGKNMERVSGRHLRAQFRLDRDVDRLQRGARSGDDSRPQFSRSVQVIRETQTVA